MNKLDLADSDRDRAMRSLVGVVGDATGASPVARTARPPADVPVPDDDDEDGGNLSWAVKLLGLKGVAPPPVFSGRQEDWAEWCFKFRSAMDLLTIGKYLRLAEPVGRPITMTPQEMSPAVKKKSELLHAILVAVCNGKAFTLLKLVWENNSLGVSRLLADEYAPKAALRHAAMLSSLLKPVFYDLTFIEEWHAWEVKVSRYEEATSRQIPDGAKTTAFVAALPKHVRQFLNVNTDCPETYDQIQWAIKSYLARGTGFTSEGFERPVMMDVGGVWQTGQPAGQPAKPAGKGTVISRPCRNCPGWHLGKDCTKPGGKAAGKGKSDKGKGNGKAGKGKGKGKQMQAPQSQQQQQPAQRPQQQQQQHQQQQQTGVFQGYCNSCGTWGHRVANCRRSGVQVVDQGEVASIDPVEVAVPENFDEDRGVVPMVTPMNESEEKDGVPMNELEEKNSVPTNEPEEKDGAPMNELKEKDREVYDDYVKLLAEHDASWMPGDFTAEQASPKGKPSEFRWRGLAQQLLTGGCTMAPVDRPEITKQRVQLLVGSGSFIHVASLTLAPWIPLREKDQKVKAVGADGREFTYYGQREVTMITSNRMVRIPFHIMDFARPILSVGELLRKGHRVTLGSGMSTIQTSDIMIPLVRQGNLTFLDAVVKEMPESWKSVLTADDPVELENNIVLQEMPGTIQNIDQEKWCLIEWACEPTSVLSAWFLDHGHDAIRLTRDVIDLSAASAVRKVMKIARERERQGFKFLVWAALPCTAWCKWQVNEIRNPKNTAALENARAETIRMVNIFGKFIRQLSRENSKAEFAFEWPRGAAGWREDAVQRLGRYLPHEAILDACAVGFQDSQGVPLLKPWRMVSSTSAPTSPLSRYRCKRDHIHGCKRGKEAQRSGCYTFQLAEAVGHAMTAQNILAPLRTQNDYGYEEIQKKSAARDREGTYELSETKKLFSPMAIKPDFCIARTWADGKGGQCTRKREGASRMCGPHNAQAHSSGGLPHGRTDGPIPPKKLAEFLRCSGRQARSEKIEEEIPKDDEEVLGGDQEEKEEVSDKQDEEPPSDHEEGGRDPIPAKLPKPPSAEAQLKHQITHIPFASWCPACVAGRAQDNPHRQQDRSFPARPLTQVDYFLKSAAPDDSTATILLANIAGTGWSFAEVVGRVRSRARCTRTLRARCRRQVSHVQIFVSAPIRRGQWRAP